jgi:hypothetical protein
MPRRRQRVRSLEEAAAFVDEVGVALVYPSPDLVLPALWEAVAGPGPLEWAVRDESGKFLAFTPEFDSVWRWKDELAERRLACAGKHLGRVAVLVAPELVPLLYALTGRAGRADDFRAVELTPLQREVAEAVLEHGPCSGPELRLLLGGGDKRRVDAALTALQRLLVLTNAGSVEQEQGWPAIRHDLLARRWRARLRRLPPLDQARSRLAQRVLDAAGEASAADVAAALGWRPPQAAEALDALAGAGAATVREEDGIRLWSR